MKKEQTHFREVIQKGLADIKAGRVISLDEARRRLQLAPARSGK